uniref:Sulfatase-like hydrolase/transferase n=1 Tax=Roseihalotalea indica TaxID=2867963 RepID=A0AA49GHC4_9BACT|nr:sulfatase-like hydrolase/transferase [Tunicatimonas sp. TK19036]
MNKIIILLINTVVVAIFVPAIVVAQNQKPNILVIITDQQNANMMSCVGNPWLKTPNLDKLAERGMRFEKAYVTNPVCSPSRFSLFTGLYPSSINMRHNASKIDPKKVEEIIPGSMGYTFKNAGYETYYGGKVHLPLAGKTAEKYGFDNLISLDERDDLAEKTEEFLANRTSASPFLTVVNFINPHDICYAAIKDFPPQNRAPATVPEPLYEAIKIPDSLTEEEFFASYCPPLPDNFEPTRNEPEAIQDLRKLHSFTMDARENWTERDWRLHRWAYHRLTERVDEQIGRVLDALQRSEVRDNTIVIFTSDHGEMSGSHRLEHKTVFYEESSNVPLIVWFEGMKQRGEVDNQHLISNGLDLYPTLCELAGLEVPSGLPGLSFAPLLHGNAREYNGRKYLVLENELGFMARDTRFKYALYDNGDEMLIDTSNDPGEMLNIAGNSSYEKEQTAMKNYLLKHIKK